MTKLPLVIKNSLKSKTDELQNLKRSYNHMIIESFCIQRMELLKHLKNFSPSTIEFKFLRIFDESMSQIFLNSNENITKLVFHKCDLPRFTSPSTLNSLKSLSVSATGWRILNMFPLCKNIQELKINGPPFRSGTWRDDEQYLTAFMTGQEKLETLIIPCYFPLDINTMIDAKYNLKQLTVCQHLNLLSAQDEIEKRNFANRYENAHTRTRYEINDDENVIETNAWLLQIIARHKDSLENLEICVRGENLMEFIMENLKVRRLFITADLLPTNCQVFIKTQPNLHLKELIICRKIRNSEALQGLIRTYPKIESLIIKNVQEDVINETLIVIANTLENLKLLHLHKVTFNTPDAPMPSLRTFKVEIINGIKDFLTFCFNIPSIEHLAVKWLPARLTIGFIQIMTSRLPQLKRIKLGYEFELTSEILEIFSSNCPQLRLIEILNNKHKARSNVTHGKIEVVYFAQCFTEHVFKEGRTLRCDSGDVLISYAQADLPNV